MGNVQSILNFIRNGINEENIDDIISVFTRKLNEDGKDADIYIGDLVKSVRRFKIGANHIGTFTRGGLYSANSKFISDNILLNVGGGIAADDADLMVDETPDAYKILIEKIKNEPNATFENLMKIVYDTTIEYFGTTENAIEAREAYYEEHDVYSKEEKGRISDFKGKNMAACMERAALSQNLMKFLGIESTLKVSSINVDGKDDVHAFNLIGVDGKYYLFDATIPVVNKNGEVTPIITEIPEQAYQKLIHPFHKDDVAVETEFDSLRGHRKITYNSWSKNIVDTRIFKNQDEMQSSNEGNDFADDQDAR